MATKTSLLLTVVTVRCVHQICVAAKIHTARIRRGGDKRDMEVDDTNVNRDFRLLTDVSLMRFEELATVPLSWPVVVDTETQVGDGCGRPAGWLNSKSDYCVMDEIVLDPEMSPIVSVRSVAVPAFLPTKSEVCSLAVLAGGPCCGSPPGSFSWGGGGRSPCCGSPPGSFSWGGVRAAAAPLAVVESVTARVSVLLDGSELPTVYEVGNGALDEVGLSAEQSCFRMDSEDTLLAL